MTVLANRSNAEPAGHLSLADFEAILNGCAERPA